MGRVVTPNEAALALEGPFAPPSGVLRVVSLGTELVVARDTRPGCMAAPLERPTLLECPFFVGEREE